MMDGRIKTINRERGFGFIRADDGTDYFFHRSALVAGLRFEDLFEGNRIAFELADSTKGPRAGKVAVTGVD